MKKVFVTREIPEIGIDLLREKYLTEVYHGKGGIPRELLKEKVKSLDAIICILSEQMDKEIIDLATRLKVISVMAVGYNNVDVDYATLKGIFVTNTPDVLTDATADLAWALLLAVSRRLIEGDQMCRPGIFDGWGPLTLLGQDLSGKTLGIIGAGRIGSAVAQRSVGWRMKVIYYNRSKAIRLEESLGAKQVDLETLCRESDFISIHLPLTPETHHLIDEAAFRFMKRSAYIINTARGAIVDEQALVRALWDKQIAGAALDVFENEPVIHKDLVTMNNVVLTPHIGSATVQTRNKMAKMAALNLTAVLEGRNPLHLVNKEILNK
jgi:glyoxylate reductase